MNKTKWERWGAASGYLVLALGIAAAAFERGAPPANAPTEESLAFFTTYRSELRMQSLLFVLSAGVYVWWFGSLAVLSLPSLVIPFAGILMGVVRAWLWGVLFSPFGGEMQPRLLPHALTILLEGEAYVVAMLGVWLWWWPVLRSPGRRWQRWRDGLVLQGRNYCLVALLLAIAAIYEALEVILLLPRLLTQ